MKLKNALMNMHKFYIILKYSGLGFLAFALLGFVFTFLWCTFVHRRGAHGYGAVVYAIMALYFGLAGMIIGTIYGLFKTLK